MKADRLILGAYQTNCYILRDSETAKDCLIVDTGLEAGGLVDFLQEHKLNPVAVVLTHGHADHITGVPTLRKSFSGIKVYIHKFDSKMLTETGSLLSAPMGKLSNTERACSSLEEGDIIEQAGIKLEVFHTPGHTPGGICLYSRDEGIVFVGDTLFAGSVGRPDMPGGNMRQLMQSIKEKLLVLPDETIVYTGHGPVTTIADERNTNPYLK